MDIAPYPDRLRPGFGHAVALLAIFIGLQSVLITPFFLWSFLKTRHLDVPVVGLALASTGSMLATVWLGTLICKEPWRVLVRIGSVPWRYLPALLLLSLGGFILCSEVENLTRYVLPISRGFAEMVEKLLNIHDSPVAAAILLVVIAPVSEEIICRRWVMGSLLGRCSPFAAIVVSALIFGAMHMNPWQFFYATVLGAIFGFIYWRTRSVMLCILAHGLNNGTSFALGVIQPEFLGVTGSYSDPVEFQPLWLNASALILLLLGAAWLWRMTRGSLAASPAGVPELPPVISSDIPPVL